jgi:hypothetical protein
MSYLVRQRRHLDINKNISKQQHHKKSKEIGDYILCRTIGRGASGKFSNDSPFSFPFSFMIFPILNQSEPLYKNL